MTVAAIDFGRRWIGLAITDAGGRGAFPIATIERHSLVRDLEMIRARLAEFEVARVIVGLPLNMDGTAGSQAYAAENFAQRLRVATGLAVELFDERLTSFEAQDRLRAMPRMRAMPHRGRDKHTIDAVAASVILESWLARSSK
jgi:putative Holliday junction resolvase